MKQLIKDAIARALSGLRLPFRAKLSALGNGAAVQLIQAKGLAGETLQAVELFQHFGFSSGPPAGTQLIVLPLGGSTAHSVIVATENGAYRVDVQSGEACIYSQWGDKVHLKKWRIEVETKTYHVKATEQVLFETPAFNMIAPGGGATAASITGSMRASGDMSAGPVSLRGHVHVEHDNGGPTAPPTGG